jgi:hypothetical protein
MPCTEDAAKEECEEGYTIQLDGLRRKWNWQGSQPSNGTRCSPLIRLFPGRTTFVNTLCGKKVLHAKEADDAASAHLEEGVRIKPVTVGEQFTFRRSISVNLIRIRARAGRGRHTYIFDHC